MSARVSHAAWKMASESRCGCGHHSSRSLRLAAARDDTRCMTCHIAGLMARREHDARDLAATYCTMTFRVVRWRAGVTSSGNEATVLLGTLGGPTTGGTAASARSLALHGMPQPPERMIVVARTTQETGWLHLQFGDIPVAVYQAVANITAHRERCPQGACADPKGMCGVCDVACECAQCCLAEMFCACI